MDREGWNERYRGAEFVWTVEPNRFLVAEAGSLQPGSVLDLAAGEGRNAVWLAQQGWKATAVDFSDVGVAKARGLAESAGVAARVETVCADVTEYDPPTTFDLVLIFYLHIPADQFGNVLGRAARAVGAGGTLLVVGHDATNLTDGYGGPQDPAVLYSPDDLADVMRSHGLEVEKAERVERVVTTDDGERTAIDTLVRARRAA